MSALATSIQYCPGRCAEDQKAVSHIFCTVLSSLDFGYDPRGEAPIKILSVSTSWPLGTNVF